MHDVYRIAIADGDPSALATLRASLLSEGHEVVAEARSGKELIEACARVHAQIVITEANFGAANDLNIVQRIVDAQHIPIIIVAESASDEAIAAATVCRPMAYLVKPIRDSELRAAIVICMQRFGELAVMRQSIEDRKIVERAKGILMRQRRCDETTAFSLLQKLARDHRQKLTAISQSIILAEQALIPHASAQDVTDSSSGRAS
jgi:AmiR/NasT family two-component response regulator